MANVKEFSFRVTGTFGAARPFESDFLIYATTLAEAEQQLELCLGSFDEVSSSKFELLSEADADDYGREQYEEGGSFAVFDPRFATQAGDA